MRRSARQRGELVWWLVNIRLLFLLICVRSDARPEAAIRLRPHYHSLLQLIALVAPAIRTRTCHWACSWAVTCCCGGLRQQCKLKHISCVLDSGAGGAEQRVRARVQPAARTAAARGVRAHGPRAHRHCRPLRAQGSAPSSCKMRHDHRIRLGVSWAERSVQRLMCPQRVCPSIADGWLEAGCS